MSLRERLFGKRKDPGLPRPPVPDDVRLARSFADLWHEIEGIAREDGLRGRSAVEHFNLTAEGKKDVDRWIQIYLRRLDPARARRLPEHHHRHRGFCLIPRLWPEGLRWAAVNEETLFLAPVPEQPDRESLIAALDAFLKT